MKRLTCLTLLLLLTLGLSNCGQKGGLTRPEPAGYVGNVQ